MIPDGFYLSDGVPCVTWDWALRFQLANNRPIRIVGAVCGEHACAALATRRTYWPAHDGYQLRCAAHAERMRRIADAMGFALKVETVHVEATHEDASAQRFAMMELD